jgi:peptide/nickel transport system permease protein
VAAFLLRRLAHGVVVLLVVSVLAFLLGSVVGDPVASLLGLDATPEAVATLRARLHLDDPLPLRYLHWLGGLLSGDLGQSYAAQRPVADLVAERIPATLELAFVALLFSLSLGIPLGVVAAVHRRRAWANGLLTASVLGVSLPSFVVGIGLITVFAVWLRWLPAFGRGEVVAVGGWTTGLLTTSGLKSLLMPALALAVSQMALVARLVRAEMIDVLRADYIRFARARGVPEGRLNFVHALRNTLIPIVTVSGIQLGYLVAFAVVVEQVFQWPGMGTLFLGALERTDLPVISAFLILAAAFFVLINLVVDLVYALLDPRLRHAAGMARA